MDLIQGVLLICSFFALISCAPSETKNIEKRSAESAHSADVASFDENDLDKRVFRYGKRAVFRYGKRPAVFRYGKRSDDFGDELFDEEDKRVFRYGKRDGGKRVFRFGKRGDEGDRERRVFRYGKRSDLDEDQVEAIKRKVFRFGKRFDDGGPILLDFPRDTRANAPHVPFRFGEE